MPRMTLPGDHPASFHVTSQMPIEQPTTFHLAVNLRTAGVLGLSVPRSILLRADEVIQ